MRKKRGTGVSGTGTDLGTDENMKSGTDTGKKKTGRPRGSKSGYTVSETALAQRKKNAAVINSKSIAKSPEELEYNAKMIQHVMKISEIATHSDRNDINSLRSCFASYLQLCIEDGFKVGNMAACAAMGINWHILEQWSKNDNKPEYKELAIMVKTACSMVRENLITDQKINPVIGIFWQRNYDGLRNDTEQIQSIQENDNSNDLTVQEYKKKYSDMIK